MTAHGSFSFSSMEIGIFLALFKVDLNKYAMQEPMIHSGYDVVHKHCKNKKASLAESTEKCTDMYLKIFCRTK